jgi:hypothetical protein
MVRALALLKIIMATFVYDFQWPACLARRGAPA